MDEKFSAEGVRVVAIDIREGVERVERGKGHRIPRRPWPCEARVRLSRRLSWTLCSHLGRHRAFRELVKFASGVDLLIHDIGRFKDDPALAGPPDELLPNSRLTRRQVKTIAEHHTDGVEVGRVLERVKAKLAVFSHYGVDPQATLPLVRRNTRALGDWRRLDDHRDWQPSRGP